jgi:DNA polymerase-3 subunit delta'
MNDLIGRATIARDFQDLAKNSELGHGYIFYGPSMVGKRTFAQCLANFLETKKFEMPEGGAVLRDVQIIDLAYMKQLDPTTKDSIGINAVREIKNFLWQKPNVSSLRTLIIDEAESLTTEAQNALLKLAEEPPASSLLIMITSDIESIMPTILSRLPKLYFGLVTETEIESWLIKEQKLTKAKAAPYAARAMGKPGLAMRLLTDVDFRKKLETAEEYLTSPKTTRKDMIKKIIEPDDFNVRNFLEAVIMNLAWEKSSKAKAALWHRALELYGNVNNFGLNPRLQLEALLA